MHDYRLYLFDTQGRIDSAVELRCSDDAEALRLLRAHAARHPILELWSRDGVVARHGETSADEGDSGAAAVRPDGAAA